MKTPSQNQNQDTEPTLAQAKAICAIRDRLWKYTRKSFRRFSEPRDAEALLLHLADLHEKLKRAEAKAARVIPDDEIESCIKRRIELNAEIYAMRAKYVELGYQHFSTDAQSVREELAQTGQNIIERYQRIMEPDEAGSMPLYRSQYQPRYWTQLCEAGLVHDGMIRDPAKAAQFLEAKPKQSAEELPQTLEALIALHDETWKSIIAKCSNSQDAEKHPKFVRIRSVAWNSASAQVREKIESYLRLYGIENCSLSERFFVLADYVTKGPEAFEELVTKAKRERDEYWDALHRLTGERRKKLHDIKGRGEAA